MQTHKRKRSLQDSSVDTSKMAKALECLEALKDELDGVEETESEMASIMKHVKQLEGILSNAKQQKISFSALRADDIRKLGITKKLLWFDPAKLDELRLKEDVQQVATKLKEQLLEIYNRVNMDYEPGSRMVLDAVLIALGRIPRNAESGLEVAIFPEMRVPADDGVLVKNKGYEVLLTGSIDYAVIQYKNELSYKERLLDAGGRDDRDVFEYSQGRLFIVEAKRVRGVDGNLRRHTPEAVGQAVALAIATKQDTVRFCLSNGQLWIFFILRQEEGTWVYYESPSRELSQILLTIPRGLDELSRLLILTAEWLSPSTDDLYVLHGTPAKADAVFDHSFKHQ